jgi:AraC-like DNA-binding protein
VAAELLRCAVDAGGDAAALLAGARIRASLDDLASGRVGTITRTQLADLYRMAIQVFYADLHRRHGTVLPGPRDFRLQCYCAISGRTLGEAIARAVDFRQMVFWYGGRDQGGAELTRSGSQASATLLSSLRSDSPASLIPDLATLASWHRLFGWLIGKDIELIEAAASYPPLLSAELSAYLFRGDIRYGTPAPPGRHMVRFTFAARLLERPVIRTAEELDQFLGSFPYDLISFGPPGGVLTATVKTIISGALARSQTPPTLPTLALLCNQSAATLRRRLADEGTSVQQLKEECRRELALDLLRESAHTVEQIAERLGFADARSFRRAFAAWTGQSPSGFRAAQA